MATPAAEIREAEINAPGTIRPSAWWVTLSAMTAALVALVCSIFLWAFVPPVMNQTYFFLAMWAATAVCLPWAILGIVGWMKYRTVRWTAVAPIMAVLTAGCIALSIPSNVAFAVSKSAITDAAERCPNVDEQEQRFGLYRVWHTVAVEGGCLLYIRGGGDDFGIGLAYLPDGPPQGTDFGHRRTIEYTERDGDWYEFAETG